MQHRRVRGDGVDLHVAVAGDGPPVILLHGFPENWRSWRKQVAPLVRGGLLRVDARPARLQTGRTGRSAREAYHLRHLVADVAALVRATGWPRAHVGGHDWGGIVAWTFAGCHPELVDRLVICNAPHLRLYLEKLRRPPQLFRSWYVLFFQLPRLPELVLSFRDFRVVRDMFARMPARRGAFTAEDIDAYVRALSAPGALTAALDYYRANFAVGGAGARAVSDHRGGHARSVGRAGSGAHGGAAWTASSASRRACRCGGFPTSDTGSRTKRQTR